MSWGNKKVKLISLVLVMLCVVALLIFDSNMTNSIGTRLKEIIGASSIETEIDYEIKELIGNKLEIYVTVKNEKGIENVTLNNEFEIGCSSKKKIAFDREMEEGDILNIDVKLTGESNEENYTLIATTKPKITVTNNDTLGDGTTKTIEIDYPKNDTNIKCYYSLDNGDTWTEYTKEINLLNIQRENMLAKVEYEGRKSVNKSVSYLDSIDIISFTDVTWKDGKASIGIISLNPEYIEYQINSTSGIWIKPTLASGDNIVTVENLNNTDIVYVRINNETNIVDTASITILDNVPPASFTINVSDIAYDGFIISGSTQDSESGIASYTYVVTTKTNEIVKEITNQTQIEYIITELNENTEYVVYMLAYDNVGNARKSNEVTTKTRIRKLIYNEGEEYAQLTGGWVKAFSTYSGIGEKKENYLYCYSPIDQAVYSTYYFRTKDKIDLEEYKSLCFETSVTVHSNGNGGHFAKLGIWDGESYQYYLRKYDKRTGFI